MVRNARCADPGFSQAGGSVHNADATFRVELAVQASGRLTTIARTVETVY